MVRAAIPLFWLVVFCIPTFAEGIPPRSATPDIRSATSGVTTLKKKRGPLVWISKTDTRFHASTCPRLKVPDETLPMDDAMRAGFGPCPRCSREILAQSPSLTPSRISRKPARTGSITLPGGPPYIAIVHPQHRVVTTFPQIGF